MHPVRKAILDYLAAGQASISALAAATCFRPIEIRSEITAMLADGLVAEDRITCPRMTPQPA